MTAGKIPEYLRKAAGHNRRKLLALVLLVLAVCGGLLYRHYDPAPRPVSPVFQEVIARLQETPVSPPMTEARPSVTPRPRIAIVIDDVGLDPGISRRVMALPAYVTLAFLPYAPEAQRQVDEARAAGHEIFLHLPMEPEGGEDPGPHALYVDMDEEDLRRTIHDNLASFRGYVGVNNHMGSRFSADARGMEILMEELRARELIYLDSRTTPATLGEQIAREWGVLTARRHVFLDNKTHEDAIARAFAKLIRIADQQEYALAIGHPHDVTLEMLRALLPYMEERYELVPVSALAR